MHIRNVKGLQFRRHRDPAQSTVAFSYLSDGETWEELTTPLLDALSMLNTLRHLEHEEGLQKLTQAAAAMSSMQFARPDSPVPPDTRVVVPSAAIRAALNDAMLSRCYERALRNELAVAVGAWVSPAHLTIPAVGAMVKERFGVGGGDWQPHDYFERWNDFVAAAEKKIGAVEFRRIMWETLSGAEPTEAQRLVASLPVSNFIDLTLDRGLAKALRAIGKRPVEHGPFSGRMGSWRQSDPSEPHVFYAMEYPPVAGVGWGGVRASMATDDIVKANAAEMLSRKDLLLVNMSAHEAEYILRLATFAAIGEKIVNVAPHDNDPSYWARRGVYVSSADPAQALRGLLPANGETFGMLDAIVPAPMLIDIFRRRTGVFVSYSRRDEKFVDWLTSSLRLRGITCWRDDQRVEVGDPVSDTIRGALEKSYCFVVVLSPRSVASEWVAAEIREALAVAASGDLRLLPVLIEDCEVPAELAKLDYADFRDGENERHLDRLVRTMRTAADRAEGKL